MASLSSGLPRLRADTTPAPTPTSRNSTAAPMANEAVAGKRSRKVFQTGWWLTKEKPKQGTSQCCTSPASVTSRPATIPFM